MVNEKIVHSKRLREIITEKLRGKFIFSEGKSLFYYSSSSTAFINLSIAFLKIVLRIYRCGN